MTERLVLYGYDASSYVFSVRILLAEKALAYDSVPVDVLAGEASSEAHKALHPFGKVPVLIHGQRRIIETNAILRYINDAFDGPSFVPHGPGDRARMDMAIELYGSHGYANMARVVGSHHFPAFAGHPAPADVEASVERLRTLVAELERIRGGSAYLAGDSPTLADFILAPACFYLERVDEGERVLGTDGFDAWWQRMREHEGYRAAVPDLADWGEGRD